MPLIRIRNPHLHRPTRGRMHSRQRHTRTPTARDRRAPTRDRYIRRRCHTRKRGTRCPTLMLPIPLLTRLTLRLRSSRRGLLRALLPPIIRLDIIAGPVC